MPGLELRLPLLFDAMVSKGRFGLEKFVSWTATEPAKMTASMSWLDVAVSVSVPSALTLESLM